MIMKNTGCWGCVWCTGLELGWKKSDPHRCLLGIVDDWNGTAPKGDDDCEKFASHENKQGTYYEDTRDTLAPLYCKNSFTYYKNNEIACPVVKVIGQSDLSSHCSECDEFIMNESNKIQLMESMEELEGI